ncbi:hypothetical protein [Methanosarcina sp. 1.H.A.2.2]|uniref:hypothetical protein n=1 Tax=Methanosarcina sp. 1.H.A.2.2 TaxID=1483601 RepID=UPI000620FD11|nr:hypothetical protein [Methanosarcina sp. 1.H.A.2.2]KKH46840.1 hypothetical protein EO93_02050 [Methanosarcina sp. 1.H.A.2.2]
MAVVGKKYSIPIVYVMIDFTKLGVDLEMTLNAKFVPIYYMNKLFETFSLDMETGSKMRA